MILVGAGGGDATAAFEDVGHSDDAREALENMCIGKLPPSVGFSPSRQSSGQRVKC